MSSNKETSKPFEVLNLNQTVSRDLRPSTGSDAASTLPPSPLITKLSTDSTPFTPEPSNNVYRSNMVMTKNGGLIMMTQCSGLQNSGVISVWDDSSRDLWNHSGAAEKFKIRTKDFDFSTKSTTTVSATNSGASRRKKIYKDYVTFRCNRYLSNIKLNYATNGSDTFTGQFTDTTYYTNTKGFDSYNAGSASDDWITVGIKPSGNVSVNNIHSFALQLSYADSGRIGALAATSASGGNTITLDSSLTTTDYYVGMPIFFYSGTGYGQVKKIIAYNGTTKVATISPVLTQNVTTSTLYDLGYIPSSFEINDISIVYREKSVK